MNLEEQHIRYLSDLATNETAVIIKIKGYGAFRKRIREMGFVRGTAIKVIKKAPLQDPIEYELMGHRVSLRTSEAQLIEIATPEDFQRADTQTHIDISCREDVKQQKKNFSKTIQVALVGNPNCGKTSIFNQITGKHERVGNYSGVTVGAKTANFNLQDYTIELTDLPGTYSISEYSPEELFVREHLSEKLPDVVINVVDASNLERNLFLTTQLIDMNIRVIIALNMYDELLKKGDRLDYHYLSKLIGIPIVPTVATNAKGIGTLLDKVIDVFEETETTRHIHISYGNDINSSIQRIKAAVKKHDTINDSLHSQFVAIKLLEDDKTFKEHIRSFDNSQEIITIAQEEVQRLEREHNTKTETLITDAKYAFIRGALKETYTSSSIQKEPKGYKADALLTHRWLGIPLFVLFMWAMFHLTFSLGSYPMTWIENGVDALRMLTQNSMQEGMLCDLLVDGIIGGVGGVIVFLPNILILFFCISLMEDTGYMARAAFIMDKIMHSIGLHGKSFIPMLMGFGCNVPAIMATRTLDSKKDRLLTILIIPFMSCSARLPVYILFISAFFVQYQSLILLSLYLFGILLAALMAIIFKKLFFKKADVPFVMELPPYRMPTLRNIGSHTWNKSVQYLTKMGTVILVASILLWALGYFPREEVNELASKQVEEVENLHIDKLYSSFDTSQFKNSEANQLENSYLGRLGHFVEPAIAPLGFDWKIGISVITGMFAKELVVSSMGVLYRSPDDESEISSHNLTEKLHQQRYETGVKKGEKIFTPLLAYSFMLFILLYFPCVAVFAAIRHEVGLRWAIFSAFYTTALAWIVAYIVYNVGSIFL
ncbi:MAG: ferrous iron transport protein B [Bacteroidales bacterium]|nr:ferrous iron transport protein B [Bacteroidales bacterium]